MKAIKDKVIILRVETNSFNKLKKFSLENKIPMSKLLRKVINDERKLQSLV